MWNDCHDFDNHLVVEHVSFAYDHKPVLKDLNFELHQSGLYCLVG